MVKLLNILLWILVIDVAVIGLIIANAIQTFTEPQSDTLTKPVLAVEYLNSLDREPDEITLFTGMNQGAFMELNGYKVYMDARPELYTGKINGKEDVWDEYIDLIKNKMDFEEFTNKYRFTHLIVEKKMCYSVYLEYNSDYTKILDGNGYALFEANATQTEDSHP